MRTNKNAQTWNFKVGSSLFGLTILTGVFYWGGMFAELFHEQPAYNTLLIVCGITGGLSGVFYAIQDKWWTGLIPGVIGGLGSFAIFDWYVNFFQRTMIIKIEAVLVCLAGALPGIILYFIFQRLFNKQAV